MDDTSRLTTTLRKMHRLACGGWLLDTPGTRAPQLSDAGNGICEVFDDFILAVQVCRFANCAHRGEPGCAVQAVMANGMLTMERFDRWRQLSPEDVSAPVYPRRRRQGRLALQRLLAAQPAS